MLRSRRAGIPEIDYCLSGYFFPTLSCQIASVFMRLSDLKTGQRAVILKVLGHGGFRRRIMEMGFVRGKRVEVLQNAPLKDPIKYKVMEYEVSLRRSEAQMIEVITEEEACDTDL